MATEKQKQAIVNVVENRGNISKAMRDAGYSDVTAKNPSNLTESKGWSELMEEYLPDDLLARIHEEGLNASRIVGEGDAQKEVPDYATRHRYLDTALKIKNKYPTQKVDLTTLGQSIIGIEYVNPTTNKQEPA